MNTNVRNHPLFGKSLYADNGVVEIVIPLDFGIRITHFSFLGMNNVFFEQPKEMTDLSTPEGWRIYGGHRLWIAPETESVYYPDNEPVSYTILDNKIIVTQNTDPVLGIKKSMHITFSDNATIEVDHIIENVNDTPFEGSLWAISSMAPGGTEVIPLHQCYKAYHPLHYISMWHYTNLGDERATYSKESVTLKHIPIEQRYKIGVGHPCGAISYTNNGLKFEISYDANEDLPYPDGNVSYETFMCEHMVELESLSPYTSVLPNKTMQHKEVWTLSKI